MHLRALLPIPAYLADVGRAFRVLAAGGCQWLFPSGPVDFLMSAAVCPAPGEPAAERPDCSHSKPAMQRCERYLPALLWPASATPVPPSGVRPAEHFPH